MSDQVVAVAPGSGAPSTSERDGPSLGARVQVALGGLSDPNYKRWFRPREFNQTEGNNVRFYSDAPKYFEDLARDLSTAKGRGHLVGIIGFETYHTMDLPGGTTLGRALSDAIAGGAQVCALLNGDKFRREHNLGAKDNTSFVNFLNGVVPPMRRAFLDDHPHVTGAHHQKIVLIAGEQGLVAYCGGLDLAGNRNSSTWHDVHCRIQGPSALDLFHVFAARWAWVTKSPLMVAAPQSVASDNEPKFPVQIARTYKGSGAAGEPQNSKDIFELLLNAIHSAERTIYVEDQFMVCNDQRFINALRETLRKPSFRYLIMATGPDSDQESTLVHQAPLRRSDLLQRLREGTPAGKVFGCIRQSGYLHAKTWVFDDRFAIIGSANMNRRGYMSDTEVVAAIGDPNPGGARLGFAHALRMARWKYHARALGLGDQAVHDFEVGAHIWTNPVGDLSIYKELNSLLVGQLKLAADILWDQAIDPA